MYKPQDVQDLIDHSSVAEGVHSFVTTPVVDGVPIADEEGRIDDDWLSDNILRKLGGKIDASELPDEVVLTENDKIPDKYFAKIVKANTFQSSGTKTKTNFILKDGKDLIELLGSSTAGRVKAGKTVVVDSLSNCSWPNCTTLPNTWLTEVYIARNPNNSLELRLCKSFFTPSVGPTNCCDSC
jgi:hypothetical protein